jgi:hypothetical protein
MASSLTEISLKLASDEWAMPDYRLHARRSCMTRIVKFPVEM